VRMPQVVKSGGHRSEFDIEKGAHQLSACPAQAPGTHGAGG
jgi:hypothetical protein